jgi:hypothetical protein
VAGLEDAVRAAVADALGVDTAQVTAYTLCAHRSGEVTVAWYVADAPRPTAGEYFTGFDGGWYMQGLGKVDSPRAP